MKKILAGLSAAALLAVTGMASAETLDFSREKYFAAGKHKIYVWCTGGAGDTSVVVDAANADEAIQKAWEGSKDKSKCYGVWQGLVTG